MTIHDEKDVRDQLVTMWRVAEYDHEVTLKAIDLIDELQARDSAREGADHYGPFGTACMNTGQFDAGECWLCYAKRKKQEAAEMQLIAGRYQFQFEQAMKCINAIDDLFEYAYKAFGGGADLQKEVRKYLAKFTESVNKVTKKKGD
jgi:hypothetical protein